jgi:hypothetical protein
VCGLVFEHLLKKGGLGDDKGAAEPRTAPTAVCLG